MNFENLPLVDHDAGWVIVAALMLLIATTSSGQPTWGQAPQRIDTLARFLIQLRCLTPQPLEPTEAARSSVIELSDARRFTRLARHAIKLQANTCIWPGCSVPATACESDHLEPHGEGGRTSPGNGAPLCGRHNRWKQQGFTIHRDQSGHFHTLRPDGTPLP